MIRAVVDTNVLISGMLSRFGNEALVLLALRRQIVCACFSLDMLTEYAEVLARPKFLFPQTDVDELMSMLRATGELFLPATARFDSPDPTDNKFLHCALAADAEFLVTGNIRHFPDSPYGKTHVITARRLLERISQAL